MSNSRSIKTTLDKLRSDSTKAQNQIQAVADTIHSAEMDLTVKKQEMKDRDNLEQRKEAERAEAAKLDTEIKAIDVKVKEAAGPLRKLQEELEAIQIEFNQNESSASQSLQVYNKSVEQLDVNAREIKK